MKSLSARLKALENKRGQIVEPERFVSYSEAEFNLSIGYMAEALAEITGETIENEALREVLKYER